MTRNGGALMRRIPIESDGPVLVFAIARLAVAVVALVAVGVVGFPYEGRAAVVLAAFVLWSAAVLMVAHRDADRALHPVVPAVDFALLLLLELLAPDTLGGVRLAALFLIAAHAHFQGEARGVIIAAIGAVSLVVGAAIRGDSPVDSDVHAFYEVIFVLSSLATAVVVGLLRTSESASRLRARGLSRRTMQAESEVRRRVAESIHDGPVQELIGLDMILSAARSESGSDAKVAGLIDEARDLVSRNVRALRDEIVELGPYAFQEMSFETAIENCLPVWQRRYGFEVRLAIERINLAPELAGDLFRIAQEAVVNAGRHAQATRVELSLRSMGRNVELRVADNGRGFNDNGPLTSSQPGHLGLASMRERAELMDGRLEIESSARGTRVLVLAPLRTAAARG
ncbi:MAG TPA: ATP-binding protein [Thermoleophilaceae bacterium]|nr:ATP-binding protein [Thermoleophilaceae bacterium]